MLNVVHLVKQTSAEINGKRYMLQEWGNVPLNDILRYNKNREVYIYEPTLNSQTIRGFTTPIFKH